MASVQAMAYGSHNAELTSAMFRRMVETKVGCGLGCCFSAAVEGFDGLWAGLLLVSCSAVGAW